MSDDRSILVQMEEQGHTAPRVKLKGTERNDDASERYEIVGELARGGVGVVHKGRDNDVGRDVALKVLHDEHLKVPELVQRFVEEAQIGGQLQHPGIVPVYELGMQADKRPFFAMKLVKGETLAAKLAARRDPKTGLRGLLAVFREVCRTMAYAHTRGVIHRDLKPSNIMIGNFGEVQVVDWGFAKVMRKGGIADEVLSKKAQRDETMISTVRSGAGSTGSIAGSVMGTPAYMPPEQALGRVEELDAKSDLFGLGAILCEILTGRPPYEGSDTDRMTAAAQARLDPALERLSGCGANKRLIALCSQCLEPLPKDRPASAEALADVVAEYITNAEGRAHRAQVRALKAKAQADGQRRKRRQTILVGGSVLATLVIAVGAYVLIDGARTSREHERSAAIETALQDAERLRAAQQWPAALAAAERAIGLGHDGALVAEIRAEAQAATTFAQHEADNDAFLAQLEDIRGRLGRGDVEVATPIRGHDDDGMAAPAAMLSTGDTPQQLDAAYEAAFAAFEQLAGSREAARTRLEASRHVRAIAANLGYWCWIRKGVLGAPGWERIDRLTRELDPGNADVRDALNASDVDALLAIAEQRGASLPLALVAQVGSALTEAKHAEEAVAFLTAQHRRAPGDFFINHTLFLAASQHGDDELALRHATAALAVQPSHAIAWSNLGAALSKTGEISSAIKANERAITLDPGSARHHRNRGVLVWRNGDRDTALRSFQKASELEPGDASAHTEIGLLLWHTGNRAAAIRSYEKAIALDPGDARTHAGFGTALAQMGDLDGATRSFERAIALGPKGGEAHLLIGAFLCDRLGRYDEALAHFRAALALASGNARRTHHDIAMVVRIHQNIGVALTGKGDWDGAIQALEKAIALDPKSAAACRSLGVALKSKGNLDAAIRSFEQATALDPKSALARCHLGYALLDKGDLDGAIRSYVQAIALDPKYATAHSNLGAALMRKGDLDGAIRSYEQAIALDPKSALAHGNLGSALLMKGHLDGAIQSFEQAIALDPKHAGSHLGLGDAIYRKGDLDAATRCYEQAIALDPKHAGSHLGLGNALFKKGDVDGAIQANERAIALDPKLVGAHNNLGNALLRKGDVDAAIRSYEQAIALDPKYARAHFNLGLLLARKGDLDGAIQSFEQAIALAPKNAQTHSLLGVALFMKGDVDGAIQAHERALALDPKNAQSQKGLRLARLSKRLPGVIAGDDQPADWREALDFAELALTQRKGAVSYAAALRLYRKAFELEPRVAADLRSGARYNAACAASLAGEASHRQALEWLRADLALRRVQLATDRVEVARALSHWKRDSDLASIRDAKDLPDDFKQLWADVDALLKRAQSAATK